MRMPTGFFISLLLLCFSYETQASTHVDKGLINSRGKLVREWLNATELSDRIDILKIRYARHPDSAIPYKIYRLELRMLPKGDNQDYDLAYYQRFNALFEKENKISLNKKLFFKFIHLFNISKRAASVHIHIYDTDISSYFSKEGVFITEVSDNRMKKKKITINLPASETANSRNLYGPQKISLNSDLNINSDILLKYFKAYYSKIGAQFHPIDNEVDSIGFSVDKMKRQIITEKKLWEKIQISLDFLQDESRITLRCYIDGQFSSGIGSIAPKWKNYKDMEPIYSDQLTIYASQILFDLKNYILARKQNDGN